MTSKSKKVEIIAAIFEKLWDEKRGVLASNIVSMQEVHDAILARPNLGLSLKNTANFIKDVVRGKARENYLPKVVSDHGYSIRQAIGKGASFEFVRLAKGQPAFRNIEPSPELIANAIPIQSVSMPRAARVLGRTDESWLAQVVARLNVLATHFALTRKNTAAQIDLLQTGVKLSGAEIDALFLLITEVDGKVREILVPSEMKGYREVIDEAQIVRGANRLLSLPVARGRSVIPTAAKIVDDSLIFIVEFAELKTPYISDEPIPEVAGTVFRLIPPVPGIEKMRRTPKA